MQRDHCLVLFFAANPQGTTALRLDEEIRAIEEKIRGSKHRDKIRLKSCWAVRPDDLLQALNEHDPDVVHFSGHGTQSAEIVLTDALGQPQPVSQDALRSLFTVMRGNLKAVVLNACFSDAQALAISSTVDFTIGMRQPIDDEAAIVFAGSFYQALAFGKSFENAFQQSQVALELHGLADFDVPVLHTRSSLDPNQTSLIQDTETDLTGLALGLSAPTKRFFNQRQDHLRLLLQGSLIFGVTGDEQIRQQLRALPDPSIEMKQAIAVYQTKLGEEVEQLTELQQVFEENGQRWERLIDEDVLVQINLILQLITSTKNVVIKLDSFVESVATEMKKQLHGKTGRQKRLSIVLKHADLIGRGSEQLFQTLLMNSALIGRGYNKLVTLVPQNLVKHGLMSQIEWSFQMKANQPVAVQVQPIE